LSILLFFLFLFIFIFMIFSLLSPFLFFMIFSFHLVLKNCFPSNFGLFERLNLCPPSSCNLFMVSFCFLE
jgi:hypothetical protein